MTSEENRQGRVKTEHNKKTELEQRPNPACETTQQKVCRCSLAGRMDVLSRNLHCFGTVLTYLSPKEIDSVSVLCSSASGKRENAEVLGARLR
jgi:hypothetical protein